MKSQSGDEEYIGILDDLCKWNLDTIQNYAHGSNIEIIMNLVIKAHFIFINQTKVHTHKTCRWSNCLIC